MSERYLVGFSGGVDSAMAACLLREHGHEVNAAFMSVRDASGRGCGAPGDLEAARTLAEELGLPFRVFDLVDAYRETVLGNFRTEYLSGRTPNPCVLCNPVLKFGLLPRLAREAGLRFDFFATGHYARIEWRESRGRHVLLRGLDTAKDQSYFLHRLGREQLARTRFPLGGLTKTEVRRLAGERGVGVHDKPDSQDFYGGDYAKLLGVEEARGDIVDSQGRRLGTHGGYWRFTPGQRKGLGVAHSEALYVLRLEPAANRVVVGVAAEASRSGCVAGDVVFPDGAPAVGTECMGRIRSAQPLRGMRVARAGAGTIAVEFAEPMHGVAPGQSLVLYDGDAVLGGGIISEGF